MGCMYGAAIGDAIGAYVEFSARPTPDRVRHNIQLQSVFAVQGSSPAPPQVKAAMNMGRGGTHCLCPGQITDDTELAMCLAAALVEGKGNLDAHAIAKWYCTWMCGEIGPFDCGNTCGAAFYSCRRFLDKPSSEHAACDWSGQVLVKGHTTLQ